MHLLKMWEQNVNIFSKVYDVHSILGTMCKTASASQVADILYILLLFGKPAIANTGH